MREKAVLMDEGAMSRALIRIAHEIIEKNEELDKLALVGIRTRGVPMAERLHRIIKEVTGKDLAAGILDITLYRDDLSIISDHPVINSTDIAFSVRGKRVILVDDVLYTGRTVRAAIEALMEMGRADCVQLAVLIDRGHRELPIRADYVGKNVPTSRFELISVRFRESDGEDSVRLFDRKQEESV